MCGYKPHHHNSASTGRVQQGPTSAKVVKKNPDSLAGSSLKPVNFYKYLLKSQYVQPESFYNREMLNHIIEGATQVDNNSLSNLLCFSAARRRWWVDK